MPNVSSQGRDTILSPYFTEIQHILLKDFEVSAVKIVPFSAGTHWVSTPLKVRTETAGQKDREILAKVVADDGLQVHQEIVANKNARFVRNGITDLEFENSLSAFELLQHEYLFLAACKHGNIFVPEPFGAFELTNGAVLLMEFVNGLPLERVGITDESIRAVFKLVKGLRSQQLVHGDIRRDNFLSTPERRICLLDYLWLNGDIERAYSYDLMSAICHLSLSADPAFVIDAACKYFSAPELREAVHFLNFITRRLTNRERAQILQTILGL